jgi:DNA modification methylase
MSLAAFVKSVRKINFTRNDKTVKHNKIYLGGALETLRGFPAESVDCCITSPPYFGLRDYGVDGQIGLENTVEDYVGKLVAIFREVRRVLSSAGTLWLVIGDSYAGSYSGRSDIKTDNRGNTAARVNKTAVIPQGYKSKNLMGIPWRVAFALQADGWYLRNDIIWQKPNCMPSSVKDRFTCSYEHIFLFAKSKKYYFDADAVRELCVNGDPNPPRGSKGAFTPNKGLRGSGNAERKTRPIPGSHLCGSVPYKAKEYRNGRDIWTIPIKPLKEAHFATFPESLVEKCLLAGCPQGGVVLDPFFGSGTVGAVAQRLGRDYVGIELNPDYVRIAERRILASFAITVNLLTEACFLTAT